MARDWSEPYKTSNEIICRLNLLERTTGFRRKGLCLFRASLLDGMLEIRRSTRVMADNCKFMLDLSSGLPPSTFFLQPPCCEHFHSLSLLLYFTSSSRLNISVFALSPLHTLVTFQTISLLRQLSFIRSAASNSKISNTNTQYSI